MNLPRHDDLENPPDFCELRDDYWQLWDQLKAAEIKMAEIAESISPMETGHPDNPFLSNANVDAPAHERQRNELVRIARDYIEALDDSGDEAKAKDYRRWLNRIIKMTTLTELKS